MSLHHRKTRETAIGVSHCDKSQLHMTHLALYSILYVVWSYIIEHVPETDYCVCVWVCVWISEHVDSAVVVISHFSMPSLNGIMLIHQCMQKRV